MLGAILENLEEEVGSTLMNGVGLSSSDVSKSVSIAGDSVQKAITEELKDASLEDMLSLFSSGLKDGDSGNLFSHMQTDLLFELTSSGFDSIKAGKIVDIMMPVLVNLISNRIGEVLVDLPVYQEVKKILLPKRKER